MSLSDRWTGRDASAPTCPSTWHSQQRRCVWRMDGDPRKQQCTKMFWPSNVRACCCGDHTIAFRYLSDKRRRALREAADA